MAKIHGPIELPEQFQFQATNGGSISLTQNSFYLPGGETYSRAGPYYSDVAIVDLLPGDKISNMVHNQYKENRTISVMCCPEDMDVAFNGSIPCYQGPGSAGFQGYITYASTEKQGFSQEREIPLPTEIANSTAFYNATYDSNNQEIYFGAVINEIKSAYVVIDANRLKYKKTIFLDDSAWDVVNLNTAISKDRRLYIGQQNQPNNAFVMCYDDNTDDFIDSIPLPSMDDSSITLEGLAIDNSLNILYVIVTYLNQRTLKPIRTVLLFDSGSHALLSQFNVDNNGTCSYPVINQEKQILYMAIGNSIKVVNLKSQEVINSIPLPIGSGDNICEISYNIRMNCIVAPASKSDMPCIYIIYNPEESESTPHQQNN
ncbi:TPA: YncE family protein [Serratia marcescens]